MFRITAGLVLFCLLTSTGAAQSQDGLAELRWLIGDWRGVGQGDPGTSASERHTDSFLEARYIRASGRSVYPKQEQNPKGEIHQQLDLWSYDHARSRVILRTFDTLGFTCTYVL